MEVEVEVFSVVLMEVAVDGCCTTLATLRALTLPAKSVRYGPNLLVVVLPGAVVLLARLVIHRVEQDM